MLSLRDCLDYCDIGPEEVAIVAECEHLPPEVAAHYACALVQSEEGVARICCHMRHLVERAEYRGELDKARHVQHVFARFQAAHPLTH